MFEFEKRDYQESAVSQALEYFYSGEESVLIESPVGSGKTIMGLLVIKALQQKYPDLRVNWVACRKHILSQMDLVNKSFFHCWVTPVSVFDSSPPPADLRRAKTAV